MNGLHRRASRWLAAALLLAVLGILGLMAEARADTVGAHLVTVHMGSDADRYRTSTPGLYWQHDSGLTLGAYRNSIGMNSAYAAWTWHSASGRWAVTAGAVGGYVRDIVPLVIPSIRLALADDADGPALRLSLIPPVRRISGGGGVHFSVEWTR